MRVVLAEDLALLRDGLIRLLEANDFEVVEAVDNGPSLLRALADAPAGRRRRRRPAAARPSPTRACGPRSRPARRSPGLPVLVLSQYVEQLYARELLADRSGGVGYLLKDRVFDVAPVHRRGAPGRRRRHRDGPRGRRPAAQPAAPRTTPIATLTPREREVLALMAEGRSNAAIAGRLFVTEKAVSKHTNNIFGKLGLPQSEDDNRRVLAVLAYLNG